MIIYGCSYNYVSIDYDQWSEPAMYIKYLENKLIFAQHCVRKIDESD